METKPRIFYKPPPEVQEKVKKYGCLLKNNPPYIIFGHYKSQIFGSVKGILAGAQNEFYAHILCKEFKKNGKVEIRRTEFHLHPNFSIEDYRAKNKQYKEK